MPYLEVLKAVVNDALWVEHNILPGESGCRDVEIMGDRIVLLRSGHDIIGNAVLGNLFKDISGYKKNADWVVFTETLVLICEMKTEEQRSFKAQLDSTKALVDFLLKKIWLHSDIQGKRPEIRFVLFSKRGSKQNLRNELKAINYHDGTKLYHLACDEKYIISKFI